MQLLIILDVSSLRQLLNVGLCSQKELCECVYVILIAACIQLMHICVAVSKSVEELQNALHSNMEKIN